MYVPTKFEENPASSFVGEGENSKNIYIFFLMKGIFKIKNQKISLAPHDWQTWHIPFQGVYLVCFGEDKNSKNAGKKIRLKKNCGAT